MAYDNLCMGCMSDKGKSETCPQCGFRENEKPESGLCLPLRTVLNNRYLIGKQLGAGGFGITYIAWDMEGDVRLAIKEYLPGQLAVRDKGRLEVRPFADKLRSVYNYGLGRFIDEARTLMKFNGHPGIVSIKDYFKANGTAYIVMAYVEGITLFKYILNHGGRLPYDTVYSIAVHVTDALKAVHKVGMLHRDISPDNIYITKEGQIKLLDFGAARHITGRMSQSLTVIFKPGFTPPEQYMRKGKQGGWTDVYATAATLYAAVSGVVPPEAMQRLLKDTLEPPSKKSGCDIPLRSEAVLMRALALNTDKRYKTINEFQAALKNAQVNQPSKDIHEGYLINMIKAIRKFGFKMAGQNKKSPVGKQGGYIVKGISGHMKGGIIRFDNETLVFGRDPELCSVVFPSEAPGISRKHCEVRYDPKSRKYILRDFSKYGTYLASGEKLAEGNEYCLRPGTCFYLYDKENMFQVG